MFSCGQYLTRKWCREQKVEMMKLQQTCNSSRTDQNLYTNKFCLAETNWNSSKVSTKPWPAPPLGARAPKIFEIDRVLALGRLPQLLELLESWNFWSQHAARWQDCSNTTVRANQHQSRRLRFFAKKNLGNLEIPTAFPTRSSHIKISQASEDGISMLAPSTCWIFGFSLKNPSEIIGKKLRSPLCVAGAVLKASARSDAHQVATLQTLFSTVERLWFYGNSTNNWSPKRSINRAWT